MKKIFTFCLFLIFIACFGFVSCKKAEPQNISENSIEKEPEVKELTEAEKEALKKAETKEAVDSYILNRSLDERIAQLFAVGIDGNDILHSYAKEEFAEGAPGAFLLFSSNIADTAEKTAAFTDSVLSWFIEQNLVPPCFMIDNEGGDVYRFDEIGSKLLSPMRMTEIFSAAEAQQYYELIGKQMKALNVQLNLAPLVEVKTEKNAKFLGRRSYGNLENVTAYGAACINGYDAAGVGSTLKHFPGNTDVDPHVGLPRLSVEKSEVESVYVEPFKQLAFGADAVLISHIIVDSIDEGVPACFSQKIIKEELRNKFWGEKLVISDDLYMGALSKNGYPPEMAVVKALKAGIDVLMISEKRFAKAADAIKKEAETDPLFEKQINEAVEHILQFKIKRGLLEVVTLDDGSLSLQPVSLNSVEENLKNFNEAKAKADELYLKCTVK